MKTNVFLVLFMLAGMFSYGQSVRGRTVSINALSYPTEPLQYKNFTVKVEGIGIIEEFGVTMNDVENIFQQTQHLVYTRNNDYNYILLLYFENPSISGVTTKEEKSVSSVQFYGVADCNVPVHKALLSPNGLEIYEKELVSKPINLKSKLYPTAEAAKREWDSYLKKNRNIEIAKSIKSALIEVRDDFQSKHDLYTYPKSMDYSTIKPSKKYTEQGWDNNMNKLFELSKVMIPGQTLNNFKSDIMQMIQFYDEQLALITKNDNKSNMMRWGAVQNITNLYILMEEFDMLPKYHDMVQDLRLIRPVLNQQNSYVNAYNARKEIYMSGKTVDEERFALAKLKYDTDSLQKKPSNVTIYYNDNRVYKGLAYVNEYRPKYVEPAKGNIIELSSGRMLKVIDDKKVNKEVQFEEDKYILVNANEVKKVVAGEEIFLPVIIGKQNNPVYAYLIHETPKIKLLSYKRDYLLLKNSDETAEMVSSSLTGSINKKVAEYFVDCPELSEKISKKEIELKNVNDLIKIADLYSSY